MEGKYAQKSTALETKTKELQSFKDRVAGEVNISIQTGTTESMNNPVSKQRLKELYDELRVQWPKIKGHLKSNKQKPDSVKTLVQGCFQVAKKDMVKKKEHLDKFYELNELNIGPPSQKFKQGRQMMIMELQLALYNSWKHGTFSKTEDALGYLGSECYWLACLMALNNPPLQPDWENHDPGMDSWNIFPQNITDENAMQKKQNQQ